MHADDKPIINHSAVSEKARIIACLLSTTEVLFFITILLASYGPPAITCCTAS